MNRSSQIGEDPDLKIGDSSASITEKMVATGLEEENPVSTTSSKAQKILEELSEIEPPDRVEPQMEDVESVIEAPHESTINNCQRDYSQPCPMEFIYSKMDDGSHKCTPPMFYSGPCRGQDLVYKDMTVEEKTQWSKNCMANWPCVMCNRNYSAYCPDDWELSGGSFECKSLNSYSGPCKGETFSFIDYNIAMQKDWSRMCKSYWPCANS